MTATTSEPAAISQRIAIAQIDAVFNAVPVGVSTAAIACIFLAAGLSSLGYADSRVGALWAVCLSSCALCHLLLYRGYRKARPHGDRWRGWAFWFTVISFAEGVCWGWAPIGLATGGQLDVEFLVLMVSVVVAEGAMVAFGPYLPAFFALFLPATLPYLIASAGSQNTLERATFPLMLVFIIGLGALAYTTNQSFKQLVGLRIRTQQMALDLQKQKDIAERQKEIAEQANLAKSTFLAAASHDLRQPVHALGIFVGALRGIALPKDATRIVEQIEASTTAMDGLFSALLDISRLDAGIVPVERRPFAIGPLLDRICRDHRQDFCRQGPLACRQTLLRNRGDRSGVARAHFAQPRFERGALHGPGKDRGRLSASPERYLR